MNHPIDKTAPSSAFQALKQFCEEHMTARLLLRAAAQDYTAARCLLLNGFFPGLVLGAQAIEKFLKAYLLFNKPQDKVGRSHSLPKFLEDVSAIFPQLALSGFAPLAEKFRRHYETRYPDNPDASTSMTTADLLELDEFIIFLNENVPCPLNVKYGAGIYPLITFSLDHPALVQPVEFWIKNNNQALAPLLPRINADYAAMKELFP